MAGKVYIACKLPHGLLLQIPPKDAPITGDRSMWKAVELKGQNSHEIAMLHDQRPGVTEVDADFWDAWLSTHKDYAPVVAGMIYAMDKDPEKDAGAKRDVADLAEEKSGFEPVDPSKPVAGVEPVK